MTRQNIDQHNAPHIMAGLPKAVIRRLDPSTVLLESLLAQNRVDAYGPYIALQGIGSYLSAAQRQQRRIERAQKTLTRRPKSNLSAIFEETHFYLICWSRIKKLIDHILNGRMYRRSGRVRRRRIHDLTSRVHGRDHLEHFEERLPGGLEQHRLRNRYDLLNMHGSRLSFGGCHLDIGPDSMILLKTIVAEFREAILYDAFESLAEAAPERAAYLLKQAAANVAIDRVTMRVRKALNIS